MGDAPRYEESPSPRFLAVLRAVVPGFEPTADGWFAVERELKRRLQIRDRPGFAALRADFLQDWTEADVLRVLDPTVSPFQTGGAVAGGDFHERPSFPARPLDPCCLASAALSSADKAEIVTLVRKVQTDFDPEADPRGWDSVAVLVRGVGYGAEEIRKMDYRQLLAIFRTSAAQMRLQKTGSLHCGIATSTSSIVRLGGHTDEPPPATGSKVFRVGAASHSTRAIDVDGPLRKLESQMRKKFEAEFGQSETAIMEAMTRELYSLSSDNLSPLLKKMGCKVSSRGIRRNSAKYDAWERYRKPTAPTPVAADLGPAGRAGVEEGEAPGPSRAMAAEEDLSTGGLSLRVGGRGATRTSKTAAERAAERDADQLARDAGVELPPAE